MKQYLTVIGASMLMSPFILFGKDNVEQISNELNVFAQEYFESSSAYSSHSNLEIKFERECFNDKYCARFNHYVDETRILGSFLVVVTNDEGQPIVYRDSLKVVSDGATQPSISQSEAELLTLAVDGVSESLSIFGAELLLIPSVSGPSLVWKVALGQDSEEATEKSMPEGEGGVGYYTISATDGSYLGYESASIDGTGLGKYAGSVSFESRKFVNKYYLESSTSNLIVKDLNNTDNVAVHWSDTNDNWNSSDQEQAVDVSFYGQEMYDYIDSTFSWDGWDGSGGPTNCTGKGIASGYCIRVHWLTSYNNAAYNSIQQNISIGDGDNILFGPLATVDIVGHEWSHAIDEDTAGLIYQAESGALDESFADINGEMLENYIYGSNDWSIASEAYVPMGDYRLLSDPRGASYTTPAGTGAGDPDHYLDRYNEGSDRGGVHHNSGIPNHAYYLLSEGGTHSSGGSMTGIGKTKAADIWFETHMNLSENATFAEARKVSDQAASTLYGPVSAERTAVADAWDLVGIEWSSGEISTFAGDGSTGFGGNGSLATNAELTSPCGVTSDYLGNVYISDCDEHTVRKVGADGKISVVAGTSGTSGYSGDGGLATSAELDSPRGLFVTDEFNALTSQREITLYIADSGNHVIRVVTPDGNIDSIVGVINSPGDGPDNYVPSITRLDTPEDIWVRNSRLFIADTNNHRIRYYDLSGGDGLVHVLTGDGTCGSSGNGGSASSAKICSPRSIAHSDYDLYFTSSNQIRRIEDSWGASPTVELVAGTGSAGCSGNGGSATSAKLWAPSGLSIDGDGTIYIADRYCHRIRTITSGNIDSYAGDGTPGFSGDWGSKYLAELDQPLDVWSIRQAYTYEIDLYGVLIGDSENHRVRMVYE